MRAPQPVMFTYDEIATVADVAREMMLRGDVRGYTLARMVEEWASVQPMARNDQFSVKVPDVSQLRLRLVGP